MKDCEQHTEWVESFLADVPVASRMSFARDCVSRSRVELERVQDLPPEDVERQRWLLEQFERDAGISAGESVIFAGNPRVPVHFVVETVWGQMVRCLREKSVSARTSSYVGLTNFNLIRFLVARSRSAANARLRLFVSEMDAQRRFLLTGETSNEGLFQGFWFDPTRE